MPTVKEQDEHDPRTLLFDGNFFLPINLIEVDLDFTFLLACKVGKYISRP